MDDLLSLTRDDINSEFKDFDFPERKKLWLFVEEQQKRFKGPSKMVTYYLFTLRLLIFTGFLLLHFDYVYQRATLAMLQFCRYLLVIYFS